MHLARSSTSVTNVDDGGVLIMVTRGRNVLVAETDFSRNRLVQIEDEEMVENNRTQDVFPINGPRNYSFTLSSILLLTSPAFVDILNEYAWEAALSEMGRHQGIKTARIWSPWPILSYCVGEADAPIPEEKMSPLERAIRQIPGDKLEIAKATVRFFLFPCIQPEYQDQAVAQLVCELPIGASFSAVRMWVDALREEELTEENISDINSAAKAI
jgi:hypothetical protein